jgi:hypothetical protein
LCPADRETVLAQSLISARPLAATDLFHLRTRALALIVFVGFSIPGRCQESPDPLPEPAPLQPDVALTPPLPEPVAPDGSPSAPHNSSTAPLAPVQGSEPAQVDDSKFRVHVRLETSVTFDDNIFIQPRQKQSDVYFGITPLIAAGWGTFQADPSTVTGVTSRFPQVEARGISGNSLLFRYAPSATFFLHHSDQDAVNHDVMLGGHWTSEKLTLDAAGRFQTLSAPDIDVGNRINSQVTSGLFNANYQMTQKTSLDSRFALEHDSYQGGLDSTDISLATILNYQVLPKTMVGVGTGFGFTTVESGQNQYYEQGLIHLRYLPTYKITLDGTIGIEVRQVVHGSDRTTPVFEFSASYAAQDSTVIRLAVSRRTETSALFVDQDIERTTIEASIRQRFFQKVFVTLSGGFQHVDYVDAGTAANRTDNYVYCGVESSLEVTKWLSMRAGYRYQDDDSSVGDFSFRRNLADFQINIQF